MQKCNIDSKTMSIYPFSTNILMKEWQNYAFVKIYIKVEYW